MPVTLKIRTGWNRDNRNGVRIARIAEDSGIAALAVHGRTRADLYEGDAEYDTIAAIKHAVSIPVLANGDVDSPQQAKFVLDYTKCDGLLIGRAAQGRPWIFREIAHFLATGELLRRPKRPKCATSSAVISMRCMRSTANSKACASRASTWLVREGSSRKRGVPRRGESRRNRDRTTSPDARLFRYDDRRRRAGGLAVWTSKRA